MPADRKDSTHRVPLPGTRPLAHARPDVAARSATSTIQETQQADPPSLDETPTTTFSFRNRVFLNRFTVDDPPPHPAPREKRPEAPDRPEHILVVDDEYWITDVIYEQLSMEGFTVSYSNTSTEVMDLLERNHYDLILLDIYMPPPDGLALLRQIRSKYPFLAVIMLTAFSDAETASRAMREGAYDYIVKPHQTTQLVARIDRALERSQLLRERADAQELLEKRVKEQTRQLRDQSEQLSQMLKKVMITYRATVKALEAALDVRDQSAPGHCRRVAGLAVQLGKRLGLAGSDLVALEYGALLHDIGKLGISDTILLKPGPLTDQEWHTMHRHPEIGCEIVGHIDFLQDALPIIRHHHEQYDGSGYPDQLAGEDIPLLARIFAIVDVYDAQTHQRPYNKVLRTEEVLDGLIQDKGKQFDPHVVDAFVAMIRESAQA